MDQSITNLLAAVQEEFPPVLKRKTSPKPSSPKSTHSPSFNNSTTDGANTSGSASANYPLSSSIEERITSPDLLSNKENIMHQKCQANTSPPRSKPNFNIAIPDSSTATEIASIEGGNVATEKNPATAADAAVTVNTIDMSKTTTGGFNLSKFPNILKDSSVMLTPSRDDLPFVFKRSASFDNKQSSTLGEGASSDGETGIVA